MSFSRIQIIILLLVSFCLSGCTIKNLINKNLEVYDSKFKVNVKIFHQKDAPSKLIVQGFAKHYSLTLRAYSSNKTKELLYSVNYNIEGIIGEYRFFELDLDRSKYWLEIICKNLEYGQVYSDLLIVDQKEISDQTILLEDSIQNPLMNTFARKGDKIRIRHSDINNATFYVKYFHQRHKPASAPYTPVKMDLFNPRSRSKQMITVNRNEYFRLEKEGLYFIQLDTLSKQGIFLNSFHKDFPKLTNSDELVLATRYITRNWEYERLTKRGDKKKRLDEFWLERGGTKDRARVLISIYYNRAQKANEYFSTYKEGWKTDRGIIYLIFGSPDRTQKTQNYEYWFYQGTTQQNTVGFFFDKKEKQYFLRRAPYLEVHWNAQVHEWRKGLVWNE